VLSVEFEEAFDGEGKRSELGHIEVVGEGKEEGEIVRSKVGDEEVQGFKVGIQGGDFVGTRVGDDEVDEVGIQEDDFGSTIGDDEVEGVKLGIE